MEHILSVRSCAQPHPDLVAWGDALLNRQPKAIRELNGEIPVELERVIARLLAKSPEHRYQHARELIADLQALRHPVTAPTPRASGVVGRAPASIAVLPFATFGGEATCTSVKSTLEKQAALIQHPNIEVAAYVGRYGWVTVFLRDEETVELALDLIDESYASVAGKTAKARSK